MLAGCPGRGGGASDAFLMPVEDLFSASGATVVSGNIRRGEVQSGAAVEIVGPRGTRTAEVSRIEVSGGDAPTGRTGDVANLYLSGIARDEVERGDVVSAPGAIAPHRLLKAQITVNDDSDPLPQGGRPQFRIFLVDVTGAVTLPSGTNTIPPGGTAEASVELVHQVACERGLDVEVLIGGRTVGRAVITDLLD